MFKIGDFSRISQVPVSTLRYYADIGLLEPVRVDHESGYRYYSWTQLPRLNRILALKDLGLSLTQLKSLLDDELSLEELKGMFKRKQAELQAHLTEEQARLDRVSARLKLIEQEQKMPEQEVVLKSIDPIYVLSVRTVIPEQDDVATLLTEVFGNIMPNGINPMGAPMTIFHDPQFKEKELDIEIAVPVDKSVTQTFDLSQNRQLKPKTLEALDNVASLIHQGGYDTLLQSYTVLAKWIEDNGYEIVGQPREHYISSPDAEGGPMTEIQYPVKK